MYMLDQKELDSLADVIRSGKLFRYQYDGKSQCQQFEEKIAAKFGVKYALLVNSGTNALVAALAALEIGPGDEVIIPSYTFVATAIAITNVGAIPVIVNVDDEYSISLEEIKQKVTDRTKAIIPVHMDGLVCDIENIVEYACEKNISVIEDTAQAFGASANGRFLGTLGQVGCYSFNADKIITAGEGGLVVTNDRRLYERMFCMMDGSAAFNPVNKDLFQEIDPFFGHSMRVSNITGAMLCAQLDKLDEILLNLKERKDILKAELRDLDGVRIVDGHDSAGECSTTLHLVFDAPEKAALVGKELRGKGIVVFPPTMQPAHVCWKWMKVLGTESSSIHPARNSYNLTDRTYSYKMGEFLQSAEIVMSTLKYKVEYNLDKVETASVAKTIRDAITSI